MTNKAEFDAPQSKGNMVTAMVTASSEM